MDIAGINKRDWGAAKTCTEECRKARHARNMVVRRQSQTNIEAFKQASNGGKKSASVRHTRSKDEIKLYELLRVTHPAILANHIIADGWDADIVLPDQMVAIMWNGPWHYRQMPQKNHSLEQVQNRDKIKRELFESLGWTVVVYEDRSFSPQSAFEDLQKKIIGSGGQI